jgi:hypothetical protein
MSCGTDEELETDHRRDGVAGEAEEADVAPHPEEKRFARLELDAPEDLPHAELEHRPLYEILLPDRDPAAGDHHVGGRQGLPHGVADEIRLV